MYHYHNGIFILPYGASVGNQCLHLSYLCINNTLHCLINRNTELHGLVYQWNAHICFITPFFPSCPVNACLHGFMHRWWVRTPIIFTLIFWFSFCLTNLYNMPSGIPQHIQHHSLLFLSIFSPTPNPTPPRCPVWFVPFRCEHALPSTLSLDFVW